jgi:hypothetical protein
LGFEQGFVRLLWLRSAVHRYCFVFRAAVVHVLGCVIAA